MNEQNPPIKTGFRLQIGDDSQTFTDPLRLALAAMKADKRKPAHLFVQETFEREISMDDVPESQEATT